MALGKKNTMTPETFQELVNYLGRIEAYKRELAIASPETLVELDGSIKNTFPDVSRDLAGVPRRLIASYEQWFGPLHIVHSAPGPEILETKADLELHLRLAGFWSFATEVERLFPNVLASGEERWEEVEAFTASLHRSVCREPPPGKPGVTPVVARGRPVVTIIGAGVTGLTAAQELAERGFRVQVIEKRHASSLCVFAEDLGVAGSTVTEPVTPPVAPLDVAVGGMARTQPAGVLIQSPLFGKVAWSQRRALSLDLRHRNVIGVIYGRIQSSITSTTFEDELKNHLLNHPLAQIPGPKANVISRDLRLRVFTMSSHHAPGRWHELKKRITATSFKPKLQAGYRNVEVELVTDEPPPLTPSEIQAFNLQLPQEYELGALIQITLDDLCTLPGEHGYRFFPSFYRHLFDTMQRTPLYNEQGAETGRTAFDNLIPTHSQVFAGSDQTVAFTRAQPRTIEAFRRELKRMLETLGFDRRDVVRFALRMLRYITSCKKRRESYEDVTWWNFITRTDPVGLADLANPELPYSEAFKFHLRAAPQALVAMDATTCDARTQGSILVQLMLDQFLDRGERTDSTLNGPTSDAWLEPWRRHLEMLGVYFYCAELKGLEVNGADIAPVFSPKIPLLCPRAVTIDDQASPDDPDYAYRPDPDYIVLATDLNTAREVSWEDGSGGTKNLVGNVEPKPKPESVPRALGTFASATRLRTFSGVQFYFSQEFQIARGHVYLPETEWGVSLISQLQFWQYRNRYRRRGVRGIVSVDIGDFDRPSQYLDKAAKQCTPEELAAEAWRQIADPLQKGLQIGYLQPPTPLCFHVDADLFDDNGKLTPPNFLVNLAGDWHNRPGPEPWDPLHPAKVTDKFTGPHIWQADHGGYQVHYNRLVYAGTYLRTFTRMTTMEAANESARHAVNAILDHASATNWINQRKVQRLTAELQKLPSGSLEWPDRIAEIQNLLTTPSITGEYCKIWDPERHELEDLEFFKRVDELLVEAGRQHMFDILGVEELFERATADVDPLKALLIALGDTAKADWSLSTTELVQALGDNLPKAALKFVQTLLAQSDSNLAKTVAGALAKIC